LHPARSCNPSVSYRYHVYQDLTHLMLFRRCLPLGEPVDLVNVAFERPPNPNTQSKKQKSATPRSETGYDVPDRLSGRQAVDELQSACPGREWRFVEVDIEHEVRERFCQMSTTDHSLQECLAHRTRVLDLMYPTCTEMDLVRQARSSSAPAHVRSP
jgi:hypothetical protein